MFNAGNVNAFENVIDMVDIAGRLTASTVVVVGGDRVEDLTLVESARDHGIVDRIILVGRGDRIGAALDESGVEIDPDDIIRADDDEQIAAATVELVKARTVDVVLKGNISTPVINRHMLPLAIRPTVSVVTIFDAAPIRGGSPVILTDAGVTTVCNFGRMVDIIQNAVDVAHVVMEIDRPKVAVLSANEKQVPSLRSTWMGLKLAQRHWPDAIVCGPLSLDLATDPGSVAVKGMPDTANANTVAGEADVLVCPGIDSANILYKMVSAMNKYGQASLASITMGFGVPYIILSRSDTVETRLVSVALCSIYAQRTHSRKIEQARPATVEKEKPLRVLIVNPGSTSLKLAVFENEKPLHSSEVEYDFAALHSAQDIAAEIDKLADICSQEIDKCGVESIDAISARGGLLPRPEGGLKGGTYIIADKRDGDVIIDDQIVAGVRDHALMPHASNIAIPVAAELARRLKVPAFTVDPVVVDEFGDNAQTSGYAGIVRRNVSHALSVRAAAKKASRMVARPLQDMNLVVAHLGGGITVAAVRGGTVVDTNIALLGEGPFSPRRVGQLPMSELIDLCYSGKFSRDELIEELTTRGGLKSYLNEHQMDIIEERIKSGDENASRIVEAMVYQISKEIGSAFVAAGTDVEAIVLTGGLTHSSLVVKSLRKHVGKLAPVIVFEGSLEMEALAAGAMDVLRGKSKGLRYELPEQTDNDKERQ